LAVKDVPGRHPEPLQEFELIVGMNGQMRLKQRKRWPSAKRITKSNRGLVGLIHFFEIFSLIGALQWLFLAVLQAYSDLANPHL
jgi:hypothetical protein